MSQQAKQFDRVLGTDEVGIPDNEQSRRLDRTNGLNRPVLNLAIQLLLLGVESGKIPRIRGDPDVFRIEWGFSQVLGPRVLDPRQELGVESAWTGLMSHATGASGAPRKTNTRSPHAPAQRAVSRYSGLVDDEHNARGMCLSAGQFQLHPVLEIAKEWLAAA